MKKIITFILILINILCISSCRTDVNNEKISVVTTCFPLYDFAKELVGEKGEVTLLLKPGQDAHSYDPTPKDIVKIRDCDVFVCVGGEDEKWVKTILNGEDLKGVNALYTIEHVSLLGDGHSHDDGHGHTYDEHIWTSPKKAKAIVNAIAEELISMFPSEKEYLKNSLSAYLSRLDVLDRAFTKLSENKIRNTVVFADRFPFLYLFEDYGFSYKSAFPGCSSLTEPSAAVISELIKTVKDEDIPYVFTTELSNGRVADSICSQTGAQKATLHSCVNITKADKENGESYISLMTKNLVALQNALS